MNLPNQAIKQIDDIMNFESHTNQCLAKVPEEQISGRLVELYYNTDDLSTREFIRSLFQEAGTEWLHKLMTRDTSPSSVPFKEFASTADYLSMLGSNDDRADFEYA